MIKMQNIEDLSKSIESKRRDKMEYIDVSKIRLSDYDIRKERDIVSMGKTLLRDGQLEPITLSLNDDVYTVVNGRTRFLAIKQPTLGWKRVKCQVYDNLSILEQNYLNATINTNQKTLTADEKLAFVDYHKDDLSKEELMKALGLKVKQVQRYLMASDMDKEERDLWTQKGKGFGRGEIDIDAIGDLTSIKDRDARVEIGKWHKKSNASNRSLRTKRMKIAKTTNRYLNDRKLVTKYTPRELAKMAIKSEVSKFHTGDQLPSNSENKYEVIDKLLKDEYEFAVILCTEGLQRYTKSGVYVDSETKRIIDSGIKDIIINGLELEKLEEVIEYAESKGCKVTKYFENAKDTIKIFGKMKRKGFVFINGAMLWTQRPQLIKLVKEIFPYSTITFIVIDFFTGKSSINQTDRDYELLSVYGLQHYTAFEEVIDSFKKQLDLDVKFNEYAEKPQRKFLGIVR